MLVAALLEPTMAQQGSLNLNNEVGAEVWELVGLPFSTLPPPTNGSLGLSDRRVVSWGRG